MNPFRNKPVAMVTGARQGLGRASAIALAEKGFDLVVMDVVEDDRAAETMAALMERGARAVFVKGDLADISGHRAMIDSAFSAFGGLDVQGDRRLERDEALGARLSLDRRQLEEAG
jgi:NAD(P)-dependent dehydrogenase (short-subunit alcohol dehydrogenase family)